MLFTSSSHILHENTIRYVQNNTVTNTHSNSGQGEEKHAFSYSEHISPLALEKNSEWLFNAFSENMLNSRNRKLPLHVRRIIGHIYLEYLLCTSSIHLSVYHQHCLFSDEILAVSIG